MSLYAPDLVRLLKVRSACESICEMAPPGRGIPPVYPKKSKLLQYSTRKEFASCVGSLPSATHGLVVNALSP
jgi:hypothetical protein